MAGRRCCGRFGPPASRQTEKGPSPDGLDLCYCLLAHGVSRGARTAPECAPRLTPWASEAHGSSVGTKDRNHPVLGGRLRSDALNASRQAALVARGGVLLDDALFGGLVDGRIGPRQCGDCGWRVFRLDQTAHGPNVVPQLGGAHLINRRTVFGSADTLDRRYCISHLNYIPLRRIAEPATRRQTWPVLDRHDGG